MNKLRKFFAMKPRTRLLLIEAWLNLGLARLTLLTREFKQIAPTLGRHMAEASAQAGPEQREIAGKIGWAVRVMSRHTAWESKCFAQAIAAKRMLARRRIPGTLYLGMAKDKDGQMIAHAWIKCGNLTLTGGNTENYTVVSTFSS